MSRPCASPRPVRVLAPWAACLLAALALGCNARRANFDGPEGAPGESPGAAGEADSPGPPYAPFDFAAATPDWNRAGVAWRPTDAGLAEARESGKPVMMVIHAEWCGPCHEYARVFHDAELAALSRAFVMILVDSDREPAVNQRYATDGTYLPRTYFLTPSGQHQTNVVSDHPRFRYFFPQRDPRAIVAAMRLALR